MRDVLGVGNTCVDFLVRLERMPRPDENVRQQERSFQCGGRVATALVAVSELGGSASFVGMTGDDTNAGFIRDDLAYYGVDTSHLYQAEGVRSGFSVVLSDAETGGRSICLDSYAGPPVDPAVLTPDFVAQHRILHLEHAFPISHAAAAMMRDAGGLVSFDGDTYAEAIVEMLPMIDVFIGSAFFYRALFGASENHRENFARVAAKGPKLVCFTFGAEGSRVFTKDGFWEVPGFKVQARDTVGAGDVYHGAFLYALCRDMPPEEAARFAGAVAAIKCGTIGGRAGIPKLATVERFLADGTIIPDHMERKRRRYRDVRITPIDTKEGSSC